MKIGIYQSYWGVVGGGQRYIAVVAQLLARSHDVEIIHHQADFKPAQVEEPLDVDLSRVTFRHVPRPERPTWTGGPFYRLRQERELGREISEGYDLFIDSSDNVPYFCHARHGVLLTHFPLVTFDHFHSNRHSQSVIKSFLARAFHRLEWKLRFATYDRTIVNSQFTQRWAKKYWGVSSSILYPPLREGLTPSANKQPRIVSIGAFHTTQHKKHEVMLKAFRQMCESGLSGWEFVLIGPCSRDSADIANLDQLRNQASGYPIRIMTDISGAELKEFLETSSILWHAMGYGVDPEKHPARMEHFGMVATEAQAAGTIPVVFNGGGLREIVNDRCTGCLWNSPEELVDVTTQLISDDDLRQRIGQASVIESRRFSTEAFERQLYSILQPFLSN